MQQFNLNLTDYRLLIVSFFLFMHGFVYFNLSRGVFSTTDSQLGSSFLLGNVLDKNVLYVLIKSLWLLAGLGFIGIGILLAFTQQQRRTIYIFLLLVSIIGIVSFTLYWDGILNNLLNAGLIGAIIDLFVIVGVILFY